MNKSLHIFTEYCTYITLTAGRLELAGFVVVEHCRRVVLDWEVRGGKFEVGSSTMRSMERGSAWQLLLTVAVCHDSVIFVGRSFLPGGAGCARVCMNCQCTGVGGRDGNIYFFCYCDCCGVRDNFAFRFHVVLDNHVVCAEDLVHRGIDSFKGYGDRVFYRRRNF
jgi:hypothetical protein